MKLPVTALENGYFLLRLLAHHYILMRSLLRSLFKLKPTNEHVCYVVFRDNTFHKYHKTIIILRREDYCTLFTDLVITN